MWVTLEEKQIYAEHYKQIR